MGARALKWLVVVLCSINALMWLLYTESPVLAALWSATAAGFVAWIVDDGRKAYWGG